MYKEGDMVRIKSREWYEAQRGSNGAKVFPMGNVMFTEGMSKFCGQEAQIIRVYPARNEGYGDIPVMYILAVDRGPIYGIRWTEDMFEPATTQGIIEQWRRAMFTARQVGYATTAYNNDKTPLVGGTILTIKKLHV